MSVNFINLFEVEPGRDEEFEALWQEVNAYMRAKPGYRSHQMHRATTEGAAYRYVNVAVWESADHWRAAHDDGFRALLARPEWRSFTSHPTLYDVIHVGAAGEG